MNTTTTSTEWIRRWADRVEGIDMFYLQSLATCSALTWLLFRAWQTLWKPVPELISILGVEVPDAPSVSLTSVKADNVTIHWLPPDPSKPVQSYFIQVNGVKVGEVVDAKNHDPAINVVGLKPGHFYNIRVFAVGSNNFQTGSKVVRVRTYGRDGRPVLENGRTPTNFLIEEPAPTPDDSSDDAPSRTHTAGIEPASIVDTSTLLKRDSVSQGGRRNTIGRKHSPSNAAVDHTFDPRKIKEPEETMQQLTEKFEAIRRDTEEVTVQMAKDAEEFKAQVEELAKEKDEKRQALKEKEDASEKLRKDINTAERDNRAAQTRKRERERYLRDKETTKKKMLDDMARWREEIEDMKRQQEEWNCEKEKLEQATEEKAEELKGTIRQRQNSLNGLDQEIHIKGLQVAELERKRQQLPGAEDNDESREKDSVQKKKEEEWDMKQRELNIQLNTLKMSLQHLDADLYHQNQILAGLQARITPPLMYHGNSSGVDLDPTNSQGKVKSRRSRNRKSRTNTISSIPPGYSIETAFSNGGAYAGLNSTASPTFAPGPYFGFTHHDTIGGEHLDEMSEADRKAFGDGAPLSPTASRWLPSDILADNDPLPAALLDSALVALEDDARTPESSSRSDSLLSSPRQSTNSLALYGVSSHDMDGDRKSLNSARAEFGVIGSPTANENAPTTKRYLPDMFQRHRGKTMQDGLALGSLKPSQSQSFPRAGDEPLPSLLKARRSSLSWTGKPMFAMSGIFGKTWGAGDSTQGNAPALARPIGAPRQRGLAGFFNRSTDESANTDRNPTSPRPASVASSELPRPSLDSAPFGWPAASELRNSPLNPNWTINPGQPWSNAPSRRASIQYGSTTALSGIVSDDDDFLPTSASHRPPAAGVIGTRPTSSHRQNTPKLDPTATPFMAQISRVFTSKAEKEKKGKDKERDKLVESPQDERPSTSLSLHSLGRMSRDSPSIHTNNSISESHESLRMERTTSNTPSEQTTPSASGREKEQSSLSKLMRKGSSKAISLASMRRKDSGIFGSHRKVTGSASNSDRNENRDSMDEFNEDMLGKSVEGSPLIGSVGDGSGKKGRGSMNWGRFGKFGTKKDKGRESVDTERSEAETTGTEDEGNDDWVSSERGKK